MEPHQERKLDKILEGLAELKPQVKDAKDGIEKLEENQTQMLIQNAKQEAKAESMNSHLNNLGGKMRDHCDDRTIHAGTPPPAPDHWAGATTRWRFVATVIGAVLAVSTAIGMAAQAFLGK